MAEKDTFKIEKNHVVYIDRVEDINKKKPMKDKEVREFLQSLDQNNIEKYILPLSETNWSILIKISQGDKVNDKKFDEFVSMINDLKKIKELEEKVYKKEDLVNSHRKLGILYSLINELDKSLNNYNLSLKYEESAETFKRRGNLFKKMKRYEEALLDYEYALKILKKEDSNLDIILCIGDLKDKMGRDQEAIECLTQVIESNYKKKLQAYEIRAQLYSKNEVTYLKAYEDYENYVKLNSENLSDHYDLKIKISRNMKKCEDCLKAYMCKLNLNPKRADILVDIGILLEVMNNNIEALKYYNQALEISPKYCMALIKKALILNKIENQKNKSTLSNQLLTLAKKCHKKDIDPYYSEYTEKHHAFIEKNLDEVIDIQKDLSIIDNQLNLPQNINNNLKILCKEIIKKLNDVNLNTEKSTIENIKQEVDLLKLQVKELVEFKNNISVETKEFEELKTKLNDFNSNENIKSFKNAFLTEFSIAFVSSQSIASGKIQIDSEPSTIFSILNSCIELIPIIGSVASSITNFVHEKIVTTKIISSSDNLCLYCIDDSKDKALRIVGKVILENSKLIENFDFNKRTDDDFFILLEKLYDSCIELIDEVKDYIQKNYTRDLPDHSKLGKKVAQLALSYIYNGDVFKDLKDEKEQVEFLQKKIVDFLSKNERVSNSPKINPNPRNPQTPPELIRNRPNQKSSSCCCLIW